MKKLSSMLSVVVAFAVMGSFAVSALSASAQTVSAITPVFYQNGQAVNPSGTAVPAGYYSLQNGDQVYYYGNGTYYDSTTGTYGGHVFGSYVAATPTGYTPVFYSQSGQAINPDGSPLSAGYYYLQNGNQVYYYGNGTYYNNTTQTYGGMIFGGAVASPGTPTAPNTGMGGTAAMNWFLLVSTALVFVVGAVYVSRSSRRVTALS
jgi:hypothetical protein